MEGVSSGQEAGEYRHNWEPHCSRRYVFKCVLKHGESSQSWQVAEDICQAEVQKWIDKWLVPHNPEKHGQLAAVLPLLAQVQEQKATTPVWLYLDNRCLNQHLYNEPELDVVVCQDTLQKR